MPHADFTQQSMPTDEQMLLQEIAAYVFAAIIEARDDGEEDVIVMDDGLKRVLTRTLANWVLANHDENSSLGEAAMRVSGRRPIGGLADLLRGPVARWVDDEMSRAQERMRTATWDFSDLSGGRERQERIAKLLFGDVDLSEFVKGASFKIRSEDDPPDPPPPVPDPPPPPPKPRFL